MPAPSLGRPRPVTETGLLRRLVGLSDPDAWEEFTGRYGPFLQRYLEHHGLSRDDALDIVQETFLEVVRRIGQFEYDRERSFGGWLATIAIRLAGRLYRARGRSPATKGGTTASALLQEIDGGLEASGVFRVQVATILHRAQASVSELQWNVFRLTELEGLPKREAAAQLNIDLGYLYVCRSAVKKVIEHLVEEGYG